MLNKILSNGLESPYSKPQTICIIFTLYQYSTTKKNIEVEDLALGFNFS